MLAQRILITGAGGFIGSRLTESLVEEGESDVHVLIRPETNIWRLHGVRSRVHIHRVDLTDFQKVKNVINDVHPDGIFHLAASNIMSGVTDSDKALLEVNIQGTKNLIDTLNEYDYQFFVQAGSFLEYGLKDRPLSESDRCDPNEFYSITKLFGTLYAQAMARARNKPIVTLRFFTPYGPYIQKGRLIHTLISNALKDKEIQLTAPEVSRDFIYIDDIIHLCKEAARNAPGVQGQIFNVGSGENTSLKELIEYVLTETSSESKVSWNVLPLTSYDKAVWQADMTKTFQTFAWRPQYTLIDGIKKTTAWLRSHEK